MKLIVSMLVFAGLLATYSFSLALVPLLLVALVAIGFAKPGMH